MAAGAAVVGHQAGAGPGIHACDAVTASQLASALGWTAGPAHPDVPDGEPPAGSTVCNYGSASQSVTVFAVGREARPFYERMLAAGDSRDVGGPGYRAFVIDPVYTTEPDVLQTFFLLKGWQYINVLLHHFPPGSAERLVPVVAAGLKA